MKMTYLIWLTAFFIVLMIFVKPDYEKRVEYVAVNTEVEKEVKEKLITRESVFKEIDKEIEIVGLTGQISDTSTYKNDNLFGKKSYTIQVNGTYKLGYDLKELTKNPDKIIVNETSGVITIVAPNIKLISLELPYDRAVIEKDKGFLREDFKEGFAEEMYRQAREKVRSDILGNANILNEGKESTNEALRQLLLSVDGVNEVLIVN